MSHLEKMLEKKRQMAYDSVFILDLEEALGISDFDVEQKAKEYEKFYAKCDKSLENSKTRQRDIERIVSIVKGNPELVRKFTNDMITKYSEGIFNATYYNHFNEMPDEGNYADLIYLQSIYKKPKNVYHNTKGKIVGINLSNTRELESLNPFLCFEGFKKFKKILISNSRIEDISALAECKDLRKVSMMDSHVRDISALENCKELRELRMRNSNSDYSYYDNEETPIMSISSLGNCTKLKYLDISENKIDDISDLAECKDLRKLDISYTKIEDISVLKNFKELKKLVMIDNKRHVFKDISSLENLDNIEVLIMDSVYDEHLDTLLQIKNLRVVYGDTYGDASTRLREARISNYSNCSWGKRGV